jgi:hypothetical protein
MKIKKAPRDYTPITPFRKKLPRDPKNYNAFYEIRTALVIDLF